MFNGLGFDEMFLVALIGVLFVKPQQIGQLLKWVRTTKAKLANFQYDLEEKVERFIENDIGISKDFSIVDSIQTEAKILKDYRTISKNRLALLEDDELEENSQRIKLQMEKSSFFKDAKSICFFNPMKKEPQIQELIDKALDNGVAVFLPYIDAATDEIKLAKIKDREKDLIPGKYGILEPNLDCRETTQNEQIELFLVPGLAFGKNGERLGHGKGYYDRLLSQHSEAFKCGIAFAEQVFTENLPQEDHDIRMDALIDPNGLTQFGKKL